MPPPPKTMEGVKLGSYSVLSEVGRGGMAVVYKARQESLNRLVAIKVLPAEFANNPDLLKRFQREAEAMAALAHPHIVQIIDKGEKDGIYYFVMEFVDGCSLKDLLQRADLTLDRILEVALMTADGLEHAHAHGIVHRDLKPANVLIEGRTGIVKIADFGIAQFREGPNSTLTASHMSMGTLNYMAPEQKVDAKKVDHRADIYAFGVILYEMLTGALPLGSFDPPSAVNKRIPRDLDEITLRCLKMNPDARYQKISEAAAEIARVRGAASGVGVITRVVKAGKAGGSAISAGFQRRPLRVAASFLLLIALAGGAIFLGARGRLNGPGVESFIRSILYGSEAAAPTATAVPLGRGEVATTGAPHVATRTARPVPVELRANEPGGVALKTSEEAQLAERSMTSAKRAADAEQAARYAKDHYDDAEKAAQRGRDSRMDGVFDRAASDFEQAIDLYRAAEGEAAQGKRDEAKALDARKLADESRARAVSANALVRAAERIASADRTYEKARVDLEQDLDFPGATDGFNVAAKDYADAQKAVVERDTREQAIEAMERASFDALAARKRAELAQGQQRAGTEWGQGVQAQADAEKARASGDAAGAAIAYGRAREGFEASEAKAVQAVALEKSKKEADAAIADAQAARDKALAAQAKDLAPSLMKRGEDETAEAREAYDGAHFKVARIHFDHARASYDDARAAADRERESRDVEAVRQAMSGARDKALPMRDRKGAAALFDQALAEERAGDEARVNGKLDDARDRYRHAQTLYDDASAAARDADRAALEAARDALSEARYQAYATGAPDKAQAVFQQGADAERQGDDAREASNLSEARACYDRAKALYMDAAREAEAQPKPPSSGGPIAVTPGAVAAMPVTQTPAPDAGAIARASGPAMPTATASSSNVTQPPTQPPTQTPTQPLTQTPTQPPPTTPKLPGWVSPESLPAPPTITFRAAFAQLGAGEGHVLFPKSLGLDGTGGVWLADAQRGAVLRFTQGGTFKGEIVKLQAPYDVATNATGTTFIVDSSANEVFEIGPDWKPRGRFGHRGQRPAEMSFPNAIAAAPDGTVLVVDSGNRRVTHFTADGRVLHQFPVVTERYTGIDIDAQGRVYLCAPRSVVRYASVAGGPATPFLAGVQPTGVTIDPQGRVYVCDAAGARVIVLNPDGTRICEVTQGAAGARLQYPLGVACDGKTLFVLDFKGTEKVLEYEVTAAPARTGEVR